MSGGLLLVGAHIGDMDFTAGHLACLHSSAGEQVDVLHLTAGEGGFPGKDRAVYKAQKLEEAAKAAEIMGAKLRVLGVPDGDLDASADVAQAVAEVIEETRPRYLVTHWRGSLHPDHANCYFAVERALGLLAAKLGAVPAPELYFAENWEDADGFQQDVTVDITPVFDQWLAAAMCHQLFRGGVVKFDYRGYYEALAALRGKMAGVARAVALMRPPWVFTSPVGRLGQG